MTQAQKDLQNQLEQKTTDLTTQPLFNDCPFLFLEAVDQDQSATTNEKLNEIVPLRKIKALQNFSQRIILAKRRHHQ